MTGSARPQSVAAALLLVMILATPGCTVLNPDLAQLERFKDWQDERAPEAYRRIIAERSDVNADCVRNGEACAQRRLIVGHACYALAESGTGDDRRELYDCAVTELSRGLETLQPRTEAVTSEAYRTYSRALLASLHGRLQFTRTAAEGQTYIARLQTQAQAYRTAYPEDWRGWLYSGLAAVQRGNNALNANQRQAGCAALREARADLETGAPLYDGPATSDPFREWRLQVDAALASDCRGI